MSGKEQVALLFLTKPTHARPRLCAGEKGGRHSGAVGLPPTPEYPAHSALRRDVADEI